MKKILNLTILILAFFSFSFFVKAASFSISSSSTNVKVGDNVRITLSASDCAGRFVVSSSNSAVLAGGIDEFFDNSSDTIYFTAKSAGSATITMKAVDATGYDGSDVSGSKSVTINVTGNSSGGGSKNNKSNKTVDINKTYSSDNTLKNLKVVGYNIDFDSEKTSYSLDVDSDVTSINIKATANDENATIYGDGEVSLTDGINNIKIIVEAENGNRKTYEIVVNVKDDDPIIVTIDGKKYHVVKKVELLTAPENFKAIKANIDGKEVPALYNDITGYILVGLKDDKGNIKLYAYNKKNNSYMIYNEMTFNNVKLYYTKPKSVPRGFKKVNIYINDIKVTAYRSNDKTDFYLVYGMNVNTGDIGWYRFDSKENTLQRYDTADLESLNLINNKYLITIIVLSVSILMLMLFMMLLMVKIRKQND